VFVSLVVRPFGKRSLTDGVDVWPEPPSYGLLAVAMPHSKWEVLELSDALFARGRHDGLFSALPMPQRRGEPASATSVFGVRAGYEETAFIYTPGKGRTRLSGWSALSNLRQYPGTRALKDDPEGTLEVLLLSDGVSPSHLYPLDVARAFRVLDRMRDHVALWWKDETEVTRAGAKGEITFAVVPSSFIYRPDWAATHFAVADSGTLGEARWWVVPRGRPMTQEMQEFLAYVGSEREPIGSGGYGLLSPHHTATMRGEPDSTNRTTPAAHVVLNEAWWATHRDSINARWRLWRERSSVR
jgi:putative spermidine/putrescine transport system substrate-binding protein